MNRAILGSLLLLNVSSLFADGKLEGKIDQFFNQFNVASNTTSSEASNSQLGVHFLGNSGSVRTGVVDVSPVHVQLPSFSSGCGGIDFTLGGINIASKEEMKKALKSIATNGIGYAFLLGIETVSPVVASTMKQIQTWANQLNAININSCEIGSSLVQGIWPKTQRASAYICEHAGSENPIFKDLIEARHGCLDRGKRETTFQQVKGGNQDVLVGSYNVAWKALSQMSLDDETKNLFMNITGTIVVKELSENGKEAKSIHIYPPMYKKAIDLLRFGGTLEKAYQIEKDGVGIKTTDPIRIKLENAWKAKVYRLLKQVQEKILTENKERGQSLTPEERNLISTTHFPMGSLLSLMTQYNGKGALIAIDRYSDLIAFERVLVFAEEVSREVLNKAESLRAAQVNGYELDEYIKQVQGVLKDLHALTSENYQKIAAEHQMIDYLIKIDRTLREKERGV
jgi:conjugative transfer pilus assembly protein TraH